VCMPRVTTYSVDIKLFGVCKASALVFTDVCRPTGGCSCSQKSLSGNRKEA